MSNKKPLLFAYHLAQTALAHVKWNQVASTVSQCWHLTDYQETIMIFFPPPDSKKFCQKNNQKISMGCLKLACISWSERRPSYPLMAWGNTANRDTTLIDATIVWRPCVGLAAFSVSLSTALCVTPQTDMCPRAELRTCVFQIGLGCNGSPFSCQRRLSFMRRLADRAVSHFQSCKLSLTLNHIWVHKT